ncbi:MAG TPA: TGS domain-containing protein, partial [Actinomycetota bacterium]
MSDLRIAVQVDGDERAVRTGTTAGDLLDRAAGKDRAVVAARVNGVLRDLSHVVEEGDKVEPVTLDSDDGRMIMRHSTAHV